MKGLPAGLLAVVSFFIVNMINHTQYALSDMQSAILMLIALVGASKWMSENFPIDYPSHPRPHPKPRIVYREQIVDPIPEWGTPTGPGNPDQGLPEHDTKGL